LRSRLSAGNNGIADFQLPISDWLWEAGALALLIHDIAGQKVAIGNWQSEIDK
jgi:hypothetical protein